MKKFNQFLNENRNDKAREWLIKQPFVIEDQKTKKLKIVAVSYYNYPDCLLKLNSQKFIELNYQTLVRFLLFAWLFKYKGSDETLTELRKIFISKKIKENNEITRPFTQIPTNYTILNKYFKEVIGQANTKTEDTVILGTLLAKKDILFSETNIIEWYNTIAGITKFADKSEEETIKLIKDKNLFSNPTPATDMDDKLGVDVWAYDRNNNKIPIQVKQVSQSTDIGTYWSKRTWKDKDGNEHKKYIMKISNTNLDLGKYFVGTDGQLHWKFLFLWDLKKSQVYQINSYCVESISKDVNNNIWITMKLNDEWLPKMIKTHNT